MSNFEEHMTTAPIQVTSIGELRSYAGGNIVELPPFSENQKFFARIKRPSMMKMVKENKIPNALLTSANKLFASGAGAFDTSNADAMKELFGVLDAICESTFVEPSFSELKEAGIELTDEQYMFIFSYVQSGVKSLESFR